MVDYWEENGPPVHIAVAAYLGLSKGKKRAKVDTGDLEELERMFSGTGGSIQ